MYKQNFNKGKLFLIPVEIAEKTAAQVLPASVIDCIDHLSYFLVENKRTSRRFISSLKLSKPIESLHFEIIDKNTPFDRMKKLFEPVFSGHDLGVLSEAGVPGVADPGTLAVTFAHRHNIRVIPLVGPSSIMLALTASGMNGQSFTFHGYLPIKNPARKKRIQQLEKLAKDTGFTQIFMETPYRNNQMIDELLNTLHPEAFLCLAGNLTGENEWVKTRRVKEWKPKKPDLNKIPTIFLVNF